LKKKYPPALNEFASYSPEKKYEIIIEMGRSLPRLDNQYKTENNRVAGCQSILHLRSFLREGKMFFEADGDALISKGLAALALSIYEGQAPEEILKDDRDFYKELGLDFTLSMARAGGFSSILLKIRQHALNACLINTSG
jgi:cysteine desulfuration protein SufE